MFAALSKFFSLRCSSRWLGRVDEAIAILREKEAVVTQPRAKVFMSSLRALLEGNRDVSLMASGRLMNGVFKDPEGAYYLVRRLGYLSEAGHRNGGRPMRP
jgi:hypothetical protein